MAKPLQAHPAAKHCRPPSPGYAPTQPAATPGQCPTCHQKLKGAAAKRYILQWAEAQASYNEALQAPNLMSQREEIALLTVYVGEQLQRLDGHGASSQTWQQLGRVAEAFRIEQESDRARAQLMQMLELIDRGSSDELLWQEIRRTLLERDRLVRSERKRIVDAREFITAEEGIEMMEKLALVVRKHVTDGEVLKAIAQEFAVVSGVSFASQEDVTPGSIKDDAGF